MPVKDETSEIRQCRIENAYRSPMPVKEILLLPSGDSYPICPRCNLSMCREYVLFCDRCGQKLDWQMYDSAGIVFAPRCK